MFPAAAHVHPSRSGSSSAGGGWIPSWAQAQAEAGMHALWQGGQAASKLLASVLSAATGGGQQQQQLGQGQQPAGVEEQEMGLAVTTDWSGRAATAPRGSSAGTLGWVASLPTQLPAQLGCQLQRMHKQASQWGRVQDDEFALPMTQTQASHMSMQASRNQARLDM